MADFKDTGGQAFPASDCGQGFPYEGMTLRDYFAAAALSGMLNSKALAYLNPDMQAAKAYEFADAMLSARNHNPT